MPTHSLKARALILCLALFIPGTVLVHAGGQAEPRLADVERLMQQKDYSAALKLLAAIQRNDPNLRDETVRIMAQIMAVAQQFNAVLEEMNQAIEAGDDQKTEQLVVELQNIDPGRAAGLRGQAQLLVGFQKLMNAALALLRAGKPAEALSTYLLPFVDPAKAGLTLPQGPFEGAGYGDIITAGVGRTRAGIVASMQQELRAAPGIEAVLPAVKALISRPPPTDGTTDPLAATRFDAITAPLLQAAAAEGYVHGEASMVAEINRSIQKAAANGKPDPYVRYLVWLWLGRDNLRETNAEGAAYAIRLLWSEPARSAADAASEGVTSAFESARTRFDSGALEAADAGFKDIPALSIVAVKAAALASARFGVNGETGWQLPEKESPVITAELSRAMAAQEYSAEAAGYRLLITYRQDLGAMPSAEGGSATGTTPAAGGFIPTGAPSASPLREAAVLVAARTTLNARATEARTQDAKWTGNAASWEARTALVPGVAPLVDSSRRLAALFRQFADEDLKARDLAYAIRVATVGGADYPTRLDSAVALRTRAEDLKDGLVNGQVPSGTGIAVKRPDQAVQALTTAGGILDTLVTDIQAQGQQLQADKDYVKSNPAVIALFEGTAGKPGYNAILQAAQAEKAKIDVLTAAAQRSVDNAAIASREGDNNYAQAQAAIKRKDSDGAASALEQATAAYLKSLSEAYTDHAAERTTKGAEEINNGIVSIQNEISVANAQKAITEINKRIAAQDYLGASDALDAAVRAWNQTQQETYPPFDNLRLTIQTAVDLNQGREISRLDPKADVVNAFIKNALDNLAAGKFGDASQNVRDALAVAPNYGRAKVLELQIRKQTDPAGFQKDATAQIATYMSMAEDRSNREGLRTAYLALQDYSTLDPKFAAQTRPTIRELSYTLGIANRPPNAQQIAQANALVQQAAALVPPGDLPPETYQAALELLKQALKIVADPGEVPAAQRASVEALRLDGLIRNRMGSTALAALSPADTQSYNQAYTLFLSGAYQDAYDKAMAVWGDPRSPRNKTYGPLLRLKKRLEVALNIS